MNTQAAVQQAVPPGQAASSAWAGDIAASAARSEQRRLALLSGLGLVLLGGCGAIADALLSTGASSGGRVGLISVGVADLLVGALALAYRRARWGQPAVFALALPALAVFAFANSVAGDPYRASLYLLVIAIWIGISQRRGANLVLAPAYTVAYWLPLTLQAHGPTLNESVPFVVIVAVACGETVAWLASRLASVADRLHREDQRRFEAVDGQTSEITMVADRSGTVTYVSASIEAVVGCAPADLLGRPAAEVMAEYIHPDDLAVAAGSMQSVMGTPAGQNTVQVRVRGADGAWHHVDVMVRNLLDDEVVGALVVDFWDITDRVEAKASLEESEESFRLLFQLSSLPTMVLDPVALHCLRVNDAACVHYGYTRDELLGMSFLDLIPNKGTATPPDATSDGPITAYLRPGLWQHETKDGRLIEVDLAVNRTRFAGVDAYMVLVVDVTEQRLLEGRLRELSLHDSLTGLANRALLQDRLNRVLAETTRRAQSVAVLFCNLDSFKMVNDTLSHDGGDQVLRHVASRLRDVVRPGDTVARFGGDEFAVMAELVNDPGGAQALAGRIIAAVGRPMEHAGRTVHLSVSIGVAIGTVGSGSEELFRSAEAAMAQAKASGKNRYVVFEDAMRARAQRRLELTNDLRAALEEGQFRLQYQPQIAMPSGQLQGFEALARWDHPTHGSIPPLEFIPLAEETGFIVPLGRWILETACREAAGWLSTGPSPLTVAVNLSVRQLRAATIVDDVRTAVSVSGIAPGCLVLEVTESVLMADTTATIELIGQLKALGIGLAVDDFGTGYSSLSYLRRFKFDILKIDKSFVDALDDRPEQGAAFIRTIVALGHTLGMQIVTEGIETVGQYDELIRLGSDSGQGYLMSRPLDPDAARAFISRSPVAYGMAPSLGASPDGQLAESVPPAVARSVTYGRPVDASPASGTP